MTKKRVYITGTEYNGVIIPLGFSKTLKYAKKIAKRHKDKIYKLIEVTNELTWKE